MVGVFLLAPAAWFEQATNRLTADCSTAELSRNTVKNDLEAGTGIEPMYKDLQSSAWATLPTGQLVTVLSIGASIYTIIFVIVNNFFLFFIHILYFFEIWLKFNIL